MSWSELSLKRLSPTVKASIATVHCLFVLLDGILHGAIACHRIATTRHARRESTSLNVVQGQGSRTPIAGEIVSLKLENVTITARSCQYFLHLLTRTSFDGTTGSLHHDGWKSLKRFNIANAQTCFNQMSHAMSPCSPVARLVTKESVLNTSFLALHDRHKYYLINQNAP